MGVGVAQWVKGQADTAKLKIGYFAAGTGAAVALVAAADFGRRLRHLFQGVEGGTWGKMT